MIQGANIKTRIFETKAILFDMDGTLVDSNRLHAEAWSETLKKFGFSITAEDVMPLIGMGGDKLLPKLIGIDSESSKGKEISHTRSKIFIEEYAPKVRAFPKARELIAFLSRQGKKLVVATSAAEDELDMIIKVAGLEGCFPKTTSSGDADHSKPDPDILKAALRKAGAAAGEAFMIGDTPYDIEASQRAGVAAIAFRTGGWPDHNMNRAEFIFDGPAALLAKLQE